MLSMVILLLCINNSYMPLLFWVSRILIEIRIHLNGWISTYSLDTTSEVLSKVLGIPLSIGNNI